MYTSFADSLQSTHALLFDLLFIQNFGRESMPLGNLNRRHSKRRWCQQIARKIGKIASQVGCFTKSLAMPDP
ncbi:hypothetical protein D3C73_899580 [compost metagenome]